VRDVNYIHPSMTTTLEQDVANEVAYFAAAAYIAPQALL
jgi:hypothetical protein